MLQAEMETIIGMLDHRVAVLKAELIKELSAKPEVKAKPKADLVAKTSHTSVGVNIRNRAGKKD